MSNEVSAVLNDFQPDENDSRLAHEVYGRFSALPGSQHIASEFALKYLSAILRTHKPKTVVEFGAGIGTITYLMLTHENRPGRIISLEDNDFCINALKENLSGFQDGSVLRLVTSKPAFYAELDKARPIDLVVVDSSILDYDIVPLFCETTVFFVEGSRSKERQYIIENAEKCGFEVTFRNFHRGYRPIHVSLRKSRTGFYYPKVKFFKKIKGCWIGCVSRK